MLKKIDDYFFDVLPGFQPLSEDFQKLTGKTCFSLAKYFLVLWIVLDTYNSFFLKEYSMWDILFGALHLVLATVWWTILSSRETPRKQNFANEFRIDDMFMLLRLIFTLDVVINLPNLLMSFLGSWDAILFINFAVQTSLLCLFYFASCTPLPPQPKKIKIKDVAYQR